MRGQVLEINARDPERAMRVLKEANARGELACDEIAFYGMQIHIVVPDAKAYKQLVRDVLGKDEVRVSGIEWIAPSLEDVFISAVRPRA
jgi:hypothetical protein